MLKRATGQSFTEYMQNLRIRKSCELLRRTTLPVKEIAARSGYRDLKFFHELFRKKTGRTPLEYRNQEDGG
jgi:AraC family L-rhamnose operon transcriptional activator RhaR